MACRLEFVPENWKTTKGLSGKRKGLPQENIEQKNMAG